jgi:hypothetical protein
MITTLQLPSHDPSRNCRQASSAGTVRNRTETSNWILSSAHRIDGSSWASCSDSGSVTNGLRRVSVFSRYIVTSGGQIFSDCLLLYPSRRCGQARQRPDFRIHDNYTVA